MMETCSVESEDDYLNPDTEDKKYPTIYKKGRKDKKKEKKNDKKIKC